MARDPRLFKFGEPKGEPSSPMFSKPDDKGDSPSEEAIDSSSKVDYTKIGGKPEGQTCANCEYFSNNSCSKTNAVYGDPQKMWCVAYESKGADAEKTEEPEEPAEESETPVI